MSKCGINLGREREREGGSDKEGRNRWEESRDDNSYKDSSYTNIHTFIYNIYST